ncbi:hypothetical protein [Companilactobacillus furfuricola]|uniref:hypothetical protein n=1 Tax=Companilactobacillus furfuricola TaxID=1462575 RepID=UPI000F790E24|nr:hypothetical protein [Companilactobacillus furfuricola]
MKDKKVKKAFYKKWWIWLLAAIVIVLLYFMFKPQEHLFLDVDKDTVTMNKKSHATFKFQTNKGNKFTVFDSDGEKVYTDTATGQKWETLEMVRAGKYKITVYRDGEKESKGFTINPHETVNSESNNDSSSNISSSSSKSMAFGKGDMVGNSNMVATITVNSVQRVDPSNDMVVDVSSNYSGMQQYVIVNYTVSSVKGDIPLDDFDGSELSVADSNGTIGTQSSNRDNGVPDTLSEGQNVNLRIGVGLKHSGNEVTIKFNDLTWKGQIQ